VVATAHRIEPGLLGAPDERLQFLEGGGGRHPVSVHRPSSHRFWAARLPDSREGTCWSHILETLVRALDTRVYEKGIKVSNAEMKRLDIRGDAFHPRRERSPLPRQTAQGARARRAPQSIQWTSAAPPLLECQNTGACAVQAGQPGAANDPNLDYLRRVICDILRKTKGEAELDSVFAHPLKLARRVHEQRQHQRGKKIYSPHAPEAECIGKGKAHRPYEFDVKVSIATTLHRSKGGRSSLTPRRCRAIRTTATPWRP